MKQHEADQSLSLPENNYELHALVETVANYYAFTDKQREDAHQIATSNVETGFTCFERLLAKHYRSKRH